MFLLHSTCQVNLKQGGKQDILSLAKEYEKQKQKQKKKVIP